MNKKIESLIKLKNVVSKQKELARGEYIDNGCYCVVGHLLKLNGVTDSQLDEIKYGKYNTQDYAIDTLMKKSRRGNIEDDFLKKALEAAGFNLIQDENLLADLQRMNDRTDDNIEEVLEQINIFIDKLQKEAI